MVLGKTYSFLLSFYKGILNILFAFITFTVLFKEFPFETKATPMV